MMPAKHAVASGLTSVIFWGITNSWMGAIACFISGILIDLDHVLDLWVFERKLSFSYKKLKDYCLHPSGKIYLFLHSYELMAVLWAVVWFFDLGPFWVGLFFGMTVHMILDQLSNALYPKHYLGYFLIYRARLGFPKAIFFDQSFLAQLRSQFVKT